MNSVVIPWLTRGYFLAGTAVAQVFNGPGLEGGLLEAGQIDGPVKGSLRDVVLSMLYKVLGYLALASIVMIVIAGVVLIMSAGKDEAKDRAKKIILYVALGLIVILLARTGVGFFLNGIP